MCGLSRPDRFRIQRGRIELSAADYALLRRKQAEIDARRVYEERKGPQGETGFRKVGEFSLEGLLNFARKGAA